MPLNYNSITGSIVTVSADGEKNIDINLSVDYFIYGTFKGGHRNNGIFQNQLSAVQKFRDCYIEHYGLIELTNGVPAIVKSPGCHVFGEIWQLKNPIMSILDIFEQQYEKVMLPCNTPNGKVMVLTFIWTKEYKTSAARRENNWTLDMEQRSLLGELK